MAQLNNILQELKDLGSSLPHNPVNLYEVPQGYFEKLPMEILAYAKADETDSNNDNSILLSQLNQDNVFSVPPGYFDGLAGEIMNRIREQDYSAVGEMPAIFNQISKENIYTVPSGYFESFAEKMLARVSESNIQSRDEELAEISPLLNGITKKTPYSVPQGYFEQTISPVAIERPEAKVIGIGTRRKWMQYAAAAVVIGFIALGGILFLTRDKINIDDQPNEWVKVKTKKVSTDEITSFIELAEQAPAQNELVKVEEARPEELKELMKDVSDSEIQEFLSEMPAETEFTEEETFLN